MKNSKNDLWLGWLGFAGFTCLCMIISFIVYKITSISLAFATYIILAVCSIVLISIAIYMKLKAVFNFARLVSIIVFFMLLTADLFITNKIISSDILDMAWRYSLIIGVFVIFIQMFLIFFGKNKNSSVDEGTQNLIIGTGDSEDKGDNNDG